jgi:YihY family inner membrane protein
LRSSYAKNRSSKSHAPYCPLRAWLKLLWHRIDEDNMTTLAGNLAYVSLLSLVPLVAVIFALFSAFPMFADVSLQLRHFVFANFIPEPGMSSRTTLSSLLLTPAR